MANLGGFAGGLARGIEVGQNINLRKEEQTSNRDFRERQIKMQEADQAWQEEERTRQRKLQADMLALNQEFGIGHPRKVQEGEVDQDDGAGNIVKVPKYVDRPARSFDQLDTQEKLGYMSKAMAVKLAHSGDPTQLTPLFDYVEKAKATEEGKKVLGALSGDKKLFDELVVKVGGDPGKAAFDPETYSLDLGNGKKMDVKAHLYAVGANQYLDFIRKTEADKLKSNLTASQIKKNEADASIAPERVKLLRAQGRQADAAAGLSGARAAKVRADGAGAGLAVPKAIADQVKVATTDPIDKKTDPDAYAYVLSKVPGSKNPAQTIKQARDEWQQANEMASNYVNKTAKKMDEKARLKKYGTSDLARIRRMTLEEMLGPTQAVEVRSGNLGAEEDEDS